MLNPHTGRNSAIPNRGRLCEGGRRKHRHTTMFFYLVPLGHANLSRDSKQVQVCLCTFRTSEEQIPGGSLLIGQVDENGRLCSIGKNKNIPGIIWDCLHDMATIRMKGETVFPSPVIDGYGDRLFLCARDREQATTYAYNAGVRVNRQMYPSGEASSVPMGTYWVDLWRYQDKQK